MNRVAVAIPAALTELVNRLFHRHPAVEARSVTPPQRRRAGVYVWRPIFGPDGMPNSDGEIVPIEDAALPPRPRQVS